MLDLCYNRCMSKKHKKRNLVHGPDSILSAAAKTSDQVILEEYNSSELEELEETQDKANTFANSTTSEESSAENVVSKKKKRTKKVPARKRTMPGVLRVIVTILLLEGAAVLFNWFLVWRTYAGDIEDTNNFIIEKPTLYTYGAMLIFAVMAFLTSVTWKPFLTMGISFSLISIISFIHVEKMKLRSIPLLPEDFALADQTEGLMEFVDMDAVMRLIFGVVFIIIGTALLDHFMKKVIGRNTYGQPLWKKWALLPRAAFAMVSLALLAVIVRPVYAKTGAEWLEGVDFVAWNQTENYEKNGFLIGFVYNFGKLQIQVPEDYSREKMQEIAAEYQALKEVDTNRKPLNEVVENVIIILDETFYDPALLSKYYSHTGGDITPNLHRIFEEYPSGYMYSPEYGGGTANVEFEVLTGLTNYWLQNYPYVNLIPKTSGILGPPNWAKEFGFGATAVHAYNGEMYKRSFVYPLMGFDKFIDKFEMKYQETENASQNPNDASVYNEILDILKENDTPHLVGAVTMQNHGPYDQARYPELDFKLLTTESYILENSFQSLHYADEYLGDFIDALDDLDERTVLLWFGDHAAGVLDQYFNSEYKSERDLAHLTPYFVYANFDIESGYEEDEVRDFLAEQKINITKNVSGVDLPTTTPNCLLNTMYDILGVEKPSLFYLVDKVCEETPILANSYLGSNVPTSDLMNTYKLVTYDILAGKHYWDGR